MPDRDAKYAKKIVKVFIDQVRVADLVKPAFSFYVPKLSALCVLSVSGRLEYDVKRRKSVTDEPYSPQQFFSGEAPPEKSPRAIIAPQRYIQGDGVIDNLGHYLSTFNSHHPAILITKAGFKRVGERVLSSLKKAGAEPLILYFEGECCDAQIARQVKQLENEPVDTLIAIGGGKCLDAGKCIAHLKSVPVITCPTLASTDAPCSALAVVHTPDGAFERVWFFPQSPALVVVDSGIIARAPLRQLVAGMGDAMATYYEAHTCFHNKRARSIIGARPTKTALAIAQLGAKILFEHGEDAVAAVKSVTINEALENVIEANILISGVGFESGGLAASHGVGDVFPAVSFVYQNYLHGEMIAMGVLIHQCLEGDVDEAKRVAEFFAKVGLPVHLGQLSLDLEKNEKEIDFIINQAMNVPILQNEPFKITPQKLKDAMMEAHQTGLAVSREIGHEAYSLLHR
jgi:glycerol dehydrogenase